MAGERGSDREAHPALAAVGEEVDPVETGVEAGRDRPVAGGQVGEGAGEQLARLLGAGRSVAGEKLAREHPPTLRPGAEERLVGELAAVVDPRPWLPAPVDLDLGRVEVERHRLLGSAPELAVEGVRHPGEGLLGRAQVAAAETAGELAGGRRRRHLGDGAKRRAGLIGTQALEVEEGIAACQDRLRHSDKHLPG